MSHYQLASRMYYSPIQWAREGETCPDCGRNGETHRAFGRGGGFIFDERCCLDCGLLWGSDRAQPQEVVTDGPH